MPSAAMAVRLDQPLAGQSGTLKGRPGDWLLRYHDGSHGVVQDAIFRETYRPAGAEERPPG